MVPWEFAECMDAWNRAQGGNKPEPMSNEEFDALKAQHGYLH